MAPKKSTELAAKKQETGIVSWNEELAKYAEQAAADVGQNTGSFINVRGGQLTFQGNPIKDNKMDVVVLDSIHENAYYTGDFDPDKPQPPSCYAFGRDEATMAPHPESADPQSKTCAECPHNKFGSAERGKGKACKNLFRMALISTAGLDATNVTDVEEAYLKVSVTSTKAWKGYVKGLKDTFKRPPFAVVTKVGVIPDPKTQHRFTFNIVDPLPEALMPGVFKRATEFIKADTIKFPYPKPAEEEEAPAPPSKKRKF